MRMLSPNILHCNLPCKHATIATHVHGNGMGQTQPPTCNMIACMLLLYSTLCHTPCTEQDPAFFTNPSNPTVHDGSHKLDLKMFQELKK